MNLCITFTSEFYYFLHFKIINNFLWHFKIYLHISYLPPPILFSSHLHSPLLHSPLPFISCWCFCSCSIQIFYILFSLIMYKDFMFLLTRFIITLVHLWKYPLWNRHYLFFCFLEHYHKPSLLCSLFTFQHMYGVYYM